MTVGGRYDPSLVMDDKTVTFGFTCPDSRVGVEWLEAQGVPHLWVGGHIASPNMSPEAMMRLARISAWSERALLGTSILLLPLYPPAIVAKQVADLDVVTDGRVVLGIGVGGEHPVEFSACQIPLQERGKRANESIEVMRELWTGDPVTRTHGYYPMEEVVMSRPSRPGGPPIVVSGRKEPAMRRAALMGDGWMPYLFSPRRYRSSVETVRKLARDAGRDLDRFAWMAWVYTSVDDDGDRARRDLASWLGGTYRQDFEEMLNRVAAAGTPAEVVERFCEYIEAGVRHFVIAAPGTADPDSHQRELLYGSVLPRLRERWPEHL